MTPPRSGARCRKGNRRGSAEHNVEHKPPQKPSDRALGQNSCATPFFPLDVRRMDGIIPTNAHSYEQRRTSASSRASKKIRMPLTIRLREWRTGDRSSRTSLISEDGTSISGGVRTVCTGHVFWHGFRRVGLEPRLARFSKVYFCRCYFLCFELS